MDVSIELIFFFVFFVPMAVMVTLNILLHRTLPDVTAPWTRLAAVGYDPQPQPQEEAPAREPASPAEVSNDEEALEAA
jgi:hypothetical protein